MFCEVVELFICHFMLKGNKEILITITQLYFNNLEFIKESNFSINTFSPFLSIMNQFPRARTKLINM